MNKYKNTYGAMGWGGHRESLLTSFSRFIGRGEMKMEHVVVLLP